MKSPQWGLGGEKKERKRDRYTLSFLTKLLILHWQQQNPESECQSALCWLLTETLFTALKLWPSCSVQGPLVFLCRNALEGSVCFPMLLAGQGLRPRKLPRRTSSSPVRSKDSLCEKALVRGELAKSNPNWLWIVLAQGSHVPGMWETHLLQMQWEELGAVLGFNPVGYWAWSDEMCVKGSRT